MIPVSLRVVRSTLVQDTILAQAFKKNLKRLKKPEMGFAEKASKQTGKVLKQTRKSFNQKKQEK